MASHFMDIGIDAVTDDEIKQLIKKAQKQQ
jgi:hypothetical protein